MPVFVSTPNPPILRLNNMRKIKIKDLPKNFNLVGCKLNGKYIHSAWNKGFWLKNRKEDTQVFPVFFKNFEEIRNWKITITL